MRCWSDCRSFSLVALLAAGCWMLPAVEVHAQSTPPPSPNPSAKAPEGVDIDTLLAAFASMPGLEANFVEEKHISMLAAPLTSRGALFFAPPGMLLRRVTDPRPSEVLITRKTLRARDANGEKVIDLDARPEIKPFVESLVWLLAGDRKSLEQVYKLDFVAGDDRAHWQLTLTPRGPPLNQIIRHIQVRGEGPEVREVEVLESVGNRTLTRILKASPRGFTGRERERLFGQAPAR